MFLPIFIKFFIKYNIVDRDLIKNDKKIYKTDIYALENICVGKLSIKSSFGTQNI